MTAYGVYKMMIQSTILQTSSINAVPDHFIKAIGASECIFQVFFLFFNIFEDFLFFFHVCLLSSSFLKQDFCKSNLLNFPRVSCKNSGSWCL